MRWEGGALDVCLGWVGHSNNTLYIYTANAQATHTNPKTHARAGTHFLLARRIFCPPDNNKNNNQKTSPRTYCLIVYNRMHIVTLYRIMYAALKCCVWLCSVPDHRRRYRPRRDRCERHWQCPATVARERPADSLF